MNSKVTEDVFEKIQQLAENRVCFDCDQGPATWASVNNGILLCLNCSGIHRGYGVNISFVRSISMDTWSEKQLNYMIMGGNHKLRQFFESYNIYNSEAKDYKFQTQAGEYYRQMLRALVENTEQPSPPNYSEGLQMLTNQDVTHDYQAYGSYEQLSQQSQQSSQSINFEQLLDNTNKFFTEVSQKTKVFGQQAYQKAKDKYNDPKTKEEFNEFKEKTKVNAKEFGLKTEKVAKEGYAFIKTGILGAYSSLKNKLDKK